MEPSSPPAPPSPFLQAPLLDPLPPVVTTFPPVQVATVTTTPAFIAPTVDVAATTTTAATSVPNHPPYAQMITEAITALRERNGSSKVAIAKYIDRVYPNLPGNHSALLTQHLKRLKESGQLVMVKHSYKLAGSAPSAPQVQTNGPKRGPGRPPKAKPGINVQAQQVVQQPQPQPLQQQEQVNATAGPGPISVPESVFQSLGLVDGPVKKRPGRPKKAGAAGAGLLPNPAVVKKRPGRPSKKAAANAAAVPVAGRPRGRPPRNVGGSGKPRGRPPKSATTVIDAAGPILVPTGYVAETATVPAPAPPATAAVPMLKRRGRPPKAADAPKKPRKLSGKPLGRPKKNGPTTAAVQVSNMQQLIAYQELRSKLDFFQSRMKQAVGVLKPFFNAQSAPNALAALQELEDLAAADITAPLNLQNRQPPPPENQV